MKAGIGADMRKLKLTGLMSNRNRQNPDSYPIPHAPYMRWRWIER